MVFFVFHFPAIWLVTLNKPWNLIGCFVLVFLSHWLGKWCDLGTAESQSDRKDHQWFLDGCNKVNNNTSIIANSEERTSLLTLKSWQNHVFISSETIATSSYQDIKCLKCILHFLVFASMIHDFWKRFCTFPGSKVINSCMYFVELSSVSLSHDYF